MDFILSLTHFCEVHGPTSILCSQVQPLTCSQCYPDPSDLLIADSPASSHDIRGSNSNQAPELSTSPRAFSALSSSLTSYASNPSHPSSSLSQNIEHHPYFLSTQQTRVDTDRLNRFGGAEGDTCASCSIWLPERVSKQLPPASPGAQNGDGKGQSSSPVLRSREVVHSCGHNHHFDPEDDTHDPHSHSSLPDSLHSSSIASDVSCHPHILTYLSLRGPPNPADYALLRRSSIRTLSCELLPRGLSCGPLCFGDPVAGYTIAYIFRLPDPMARGKRRSYALVALAGKDAGRAFRASPIIWRNFNRIAATIISLAENRQEEEKRQEERSYGSPPTNKASGRDYVPISSFLTGRMVDPDGQPRRVGQIRARNLTEIVGNELIFAELHAQFVAILQQLGNLFGGVPISDESAAYSTVSADDAPVIHPPASHPRHQRKASHSYSHRPSSRSPAGRSTADDENVQTSSSSASAGGHSRNSSDLGMSSLEISTPPIAITRRTVVA